MRSASRIAASVSAFGTSRVGRNGRPCSRTACRRNVFTAVEKRQDPEANRLAARNLRVPHYFLNDAGSAGTIIGALSRMEVVVSMRLHALIFAAGMGIPLAGVVYDPKVSAFLRYIGQDLFVDLSEVTEETLRQMIDAAVARTRHPEEQTAAVERLRSIENGNVAVARRLLGLEP